MRDAAGIAVSVARLFAQGVGLSVTAEGLEVHAPEGWETPRRRAWIDRHRAAIVACLDPGPILCGSCGRQIDLDAEDWRYRLLDGEPLCQACCQGADREYRRWLAGR